MIVLGGDIGGTNTRLIVASIDDAGIHPVAEKVYHSKQYTSLPQVIRQFLKQHEITQCIDCACFAVAGPVKSGVAKITNLPWMVKEEQLINELHIPAVKLINDFDAVAQGIPLLNDEDLLVIQQGKEPEKQHPDSAIIGAGTGLGVSHRVWIDNRYHILPSETGHAGFTPASKLQTRLLEWLQQDNGYISLESILSGKGIYTIYQFLRDRENYPDSSTIRELIMDNDPARIITEHALIGDDQLCVTTLEVFVEIYGAIAGDVALHYYPVDQLYIAGGIAPKIHTKLVSASFQNAFVNKGLMSANMENINIKLILNDKVGLYGALAYFSSI